jgi:hypothetical protein
VRRQNQTPACGERGELLGGTTERYQGIRIEHCGTRGGH